MNYSNISTWDTMECPRCHRHSVVEVIKYRCPDLKHHGGAYTASYAKELKRKFSLFSSSYRKWRHRIEIMRILDSIRQEKLFQSSFFSVYFMPIVEGVLLRSRSANESICLAWKQVKEYFFPITKWEHRTLDERNRVRQSDKHLSSWRKKAFSLKEGGNAMLLPYKGYNACSEIDERTNSIKGRVIDTSDSITFEGESVKQLKEAFHSAIDSYLEFCKQENRKPDKPFSGVLTYRTSKKRHRDLSIAAAREGISINTLIDQIVEKSIETQDNCPMELSFSSMD